MLFEYVYCSLANIAIIKDQLTVSLFSLSPTQETVRPHASLQPIVVVPRGRLPWVSHSEVLFQKD